MILPTATPCPPPSHFHTFTLPPPRAEPTQVSALTIDAHAPPTPSPYPPTPYPKRSARGHFQKRLLLYPWSNEPRRGNCKGSAPITFTPSHVHTFTLPLRRGTGPSSEPQFIQRRSRSRQMLRHHLRIIPRKQHPRRSPLERGQHRLLHRLSRGRRTPPQGPEYRSPPPATPAHSIPSHHPRTAPSPAAHSPPRTRPVPAYRKAPL